MGVVDCFVNNNNKYEAILHWLGGAIVIFLAPLIAGF